MPDEVVEPPSERTSITLRPSELEALKWMVKTNPKYDGLSAVMRDYSLTDLVAFYRRAQATATAAA